jgi:hypothetical protein
MRMQKEMSERVADEVFVMLCLALPMPKHGTPTEAVLYFLQ